MNNRQHHGVSPSPGETPRTAFFEWDAGTDALRGCPAYALLFGGDAVPDTGRAFLARLPRDEGERLAALRAGLTPASPTYAAVLHLDNAMVEERGWGTFDHLGRLLRVNGTLLAAGAQAPGAARGPMDKMAGMVPGVIYAFRLQPDGTSSLPYVSGQYEELSGLEPEGLATDASPFFANVHPDDLAYLQGTIADSARLLAPWRAEFRYRHPEKGVIWVEGHSVPEAEADGSILWHGFIQDITARRRADAALREANDQLRALIEALPDAIFFKDGQGRWQIINRVAAELFQVQGIPWRGMTDQELAEAQPGFRIVHEVFCTGDEAAWGAGGSSMGIEYLPGSDGATREFEVRKVPLFEADGSRKALVVIGRDITERKQVAEALSESRQDLNRAQALGHIGSWRLDVRRNELTWSDENHRIFGIPKGTPLTYETFLSTIHPEDRDYVDRMWMAGLGGEPYDIEHRLLVDGKVKWVREKAELEFDQEGGLLGGFGTTQDITDRKLAEQVRQQFEALVEHSPDFIGMADLEGRAIYVNPAGCALVGLEGPEAARGMPITDFNPDELDRMYAEEVIPAMMAQGRWVGETRFRHFVSGEVFPMYQIGFLVRQPNGEPMCVATIARDIGPLKQAEEALREADRRKDEFLAMLAHELRNPLTPIRNAARILSLLEGAEPRTRWASEMIERQVAHLTRLVDDLLDVSRIVRGKIALKRETVELAAVVEQALEAVRAPIEAKGHQFHVRLPGHPVRLEGDPVRLSQVLLNLLDNAAKYTPAGGQIELDARVEGGEVEIRVSDNGAGMPAELLPLVFELFQQGERTLDRSQGGLGIGLTLVQRLVEMHGGRVAACSKGPGLGSSFVVCLPLKPEALPTPPSLAGERRQPVPGVRVLVVDDDYAVADSTAILLEMEGHQVRIAHSGEEALERIPEFRPRVVLLDIGLTGMNGFETAKRLRQLPAGGDLYLVALTGYGDDETRAHALESGCDHHLVKPVNLDTLLALLASKAG